jgi:hypothetical protein
VLGVHKTISLPQSTPYSQEMAKWEAHPSQWGPAGRPYQFSEFPKRLYKCEYEPGKGIHKSEEIEVLDETQEQNMRSRGFASLAEAYKAVEAEHTEHGKLAANLEYQIQTGKVSEKAAAEVAVAREAYGTRHMPDVPRTPIKRHRRTKAQIAADKAAE